MENPPHKQAKGFEFAWLCWAPITQRFDVQSLGTSRPDPQSVEPPGLLLLLGKKLPRLQWARSGRGAQTHQGLFGVRREVRCIPPKLPPGFPRQLSKSESCCKAFQLGQTGVFPSGRLLLSLFPSLWVSLAVADVRSQGSGCAHQLQPYGLSNGGLRNAQSDTKDGISKALIPFRATFSIYSSVFLLWQSFTLKETVWVYNLY